MGIKFVASYSGGKDSAMAIHRAQGLGMELLALLTTYNTTQERSWFHGLPKPVLESVSESLGVPIWFVETIGDEYTAKFEETLEKAKKYGAEACVFGDIDIPEHISWCSERCKNTGIEPVFPLYGNSREAVVRDFLTDGFTAHFTIIDTTRIKGDFLGKPLTLEALTEIKAQGADICGENGEYHTFVSEGPIYKKPIKFTFGDRITLNMRDILPVLP